MTTRRNILKGGAGLAAILATGKAPAALVRSMLAARNTIGTKSGGAKLPYDAEVEYLESTGTQYIDTGIVVTSTTRIRALASCATTVNGFLFGSYADSTYIGAQYYSGLGLRVFCGRAATNYSQSGFVVGTAYLYDIDNSNGSISIDGSLVKTTGTSGGVGGIICAFRNNEQTESVNCKFYSIQVWDNGVLVRDFIPVRKGSVGYMYDRVSGELFGNAGTGVFGYGNDK